jgi:hypothetical protein
MVIYDFTCEHGHRFEGWFKSADELLSQQHDRLLSCPVCGSPEVVKLPTASRIHRRYSREVMSSAAATDATESLMERFQQYITENYEDVGNRFPEEARKVHYGESEQRNIYGTASIDEVNDLHEEGVKIAAPPLPAADKNKLN